jgi:hypothetical protein
MVGISELNITFRATPTETCVYGKLIIFEYELKVKNSNLERWYPRGYGNQKLYKLEVTANYNADNGNFH